MKTILSHISYEVKLYNQLLLCYISIMINETLAENLIPKFHILRWNELPDIGLYMEQVLTLIENNLGRFFSDMGETPLTKSMVNNYVKAKLVEAPISKKYSRMAVASIIVIYILKTCYTTDDMSQIMKMGLTIMPDDPGTIYDRFCTAVENAVNDVFSGMARFANQKIPGREKKYLLDNFAFSFACKYYVHKTFLH